MKLIVSILALCIVASLNVKECESSWFEDIKVKDIFGGILENVRRAFMKALDGLKYKWNFMNALDEFMYRLKIGDLIDIPNNDGKNIKEMLIKIVEIGFNGTSFQQEIMKAYQHLTEKGTLMDILAVFTGDKSQNLFTVLKEGVSIYLVNKPEKDEMLHELNVLEEALMGSNQGAQARLEEQKAKSEADG